MKIRPETSPLFRLTVLGLGLLTGIAAIFVFLWHHRLIQLVFCPIRDVTGVPCPTCGSTHAVVALLQGHPRSALRYNPLAVGFLAAGGATFLWAVVATLRPAWRIRPQFSAPEKRVVIGMVVLGIMANWLYEVWRLI
ncbi:DUF2752 domain-containing protein [bacterium]|nr:DUF2752 domain-containing protein [bacterium]